MKTILHKAADRGKANFQWLEANYSFSFANFYDANRLQFGALRVLNDDSIAPNMGFSTHPHKNMEIITIPLSGELKHKDSMSKEWLFVNSNEAQVMSAGSGIEHSEMNGSQTDFLKLFQIWIIPNKIDVEPRYNQAKFNAEDRNNKLQVLVSSIDNAEIEGLKIHQDAQISRLELSEDNIFTYTIPSEGFGVYVMLISGEITVNNETLKDRDAIGVLETDAFEILANSNSDILFIEVPMY